MEEHIEMMKLLDTAGMKRVYKDLAYADLNSNEKIDLLLPEENDGPFPVILWLHGGGCVKGHRLQATVDGEFLGGVFKALSQGYAIAAVGYSFVQQQPWPRAVIDVKKAIRFLKKNADCYDIDPSRMILWGESAGAQLAQLTAATWDKRIFDEPDVAYLEQDCSVCGLVSLFGLSNLSNFPEQFKKAGVVPLCDPADLPLQLLLGFHPSDNPEKALANSAVHYISESFPRTLLQHGKNDLLVPYCQSVELYEEIVRVCGEGHAVLELLENEGHATAGFHTDENINHILDFLDSMCEMDRNYNPRTVLPEISMTQEEYPLI